MNWEIIRLDDNTAWVFVTIATLIILMLCFYNLSYFVDNFGDFNCCGFSCSWNICVGWCSKGKEVFNRDILRSEGEEESEENEGEEKEMLVQKEFDDVEFGGEDTKTGEGETVIDIHKKNEL